MWHFKSKLFGAVFSIDVSDILSLSENVIYLANRSSENCTITLIKGANLLHSIIFQKDRFLTAYSILNTTKVLRCKLRLILNTASYLFCQ